VSTAATGDATPTYQWEISTDGGTTWSNIDGATSDTYDAGTLTADAKYRRVTTSTMGLVACTALSNELTVTVNNLTAGSISGSQTICYSGNPDAFGSVEPVADGVVTYQWESSTNNVDFTAIPSATSETYDAPGSLTVTTYYRRVATSTLNSVACTATSNTLTVTVPATDISASVASTDVTCNGNVDGTITVSAPAGGYGTYETSINGTNWFAVSAATPYTFSGLTPATYDVRIRDAAYTTCSQTLSNVTITEPTVLTLSVTPSSTGTTSRNGRSTGVPTVVTGASPSIKVRTGEQIQLAASAGGGNGSYTYEWKKNDSETVLSTNATYVETTSGTTSTSGTYTVVVRDAKSCSTNVSVDVTVYGTTVYVDKTAGNANDNNDGSEAAPFATIQKALDVTSDGSVVNVVAGSYTESPIIDSPRRIIGGAGTPSITGDSTSLSHRFRYAYASNTSASITTDSITGFTSASFATVGARTAAGIYKAIARVNTDGTVLIDNGTYSISSSINIYGQITVAGHTNSMTGTCDLAPSAVLEGSGTVKLFMMYGTGTGTKTLRDLTLQIGNATGRFIEVPFGQAHNVNTERMVFKNASGTRLFGTMNASRSGTSVNDVAKLVNDGADFGFGSGRVNYGVYAPLNMSAVATGWKAEDVDHNNNNTAAGTLYACKGSNLVNGGASATKPKYFNSTQAGTEFNDRAYLKFDGIQTYMDANTNADVNGGTAKTVLVAFRTGATFPGSMLIYKHGDENQGISINALTASSGSVEINIREDDGVNGLSTATHTFDVEASTDYIAQIYFDGASTTKRVGMALDKADGQVHEKLFTSTQFADANLSTPAAVTASKISIGGRTGSTYINGVNEIGTTRGHFFNGSIAEIIVLNTADVTQRDAAYCYLRNKYFDGYQGVENTLERVDDDVIAGDNVTTEPFVAAYPNPADEVLEIEATIPYAGFVRATLLDMTGRELMNVFEGDVPNNAQLALQANVRDLPSGAYVLRIIGANDQHIQTPVVVRH
jgi:hypothetical protein